MDSRIAKIDEALGKVHDVLSKLTMKPDEKLTAEEITQIEEAENLLNTVRDRLRLFSPSAGSSPIPDQNGRMTVLLEYSPRLKKAFVRAVLPYGETLAPLEPENLQNPIGMFAGVDHKFQVGISPLVIE